MALLEIWIDGQLCLKEVNYVTPWPSLIPSLEYNLSAVAGSLSIVGMDTESLYTGRKITCNFTESKTVDWHSDCNSFDGWFNNNDVELDDIVLAPGEGTSDVFRFTAPSSIPSPVHLMKSIGSGLLSNHFVCELELYIPTTGNYATHVTDECFSIHAGNDQVSLIVRFGQSSIWIEQKNYSYTEITNLVVKGTRQRWKFEVHSEDPDTATVDVYVNSNLRAAGVNCSWQLVLSDGLFWPKLESPDVGTGEAYLDSVTLSHWVAESVSESYKYLIQSPEPVLLRYGIGYLLSANFYDVIINGLTNSLFHNVSLPAGYFNVVIDVGTGDNLYRRSFLYALADDVVIDPLDALLGCYRKITTDPYDVDLAVQANNLYHHGYVILNDQHFLIEDQTNNLYHHKLIIPGTNTIILSPFDALLLGELDRGLLTVVSHVLISPVDNNLYIYRKIDVDPESIVITGYPVPVTKQNILFPDSDTIIVSALPLGLIANHHLISGDNGIIIDPLTAFIHRDSSMLANDQSIILSGKPLYFIYYHLEADGRTWTIVYYPVTFQYHRVIIEQVDNRYMSEYRGLEDPHLNKRTLRGNLERIMDTGMSVRKK